MRYLLVIAFSIATGFVVAQTLRVFWSRSEMNIGEQVTLTMEVRKFKGDFQFDPVNGTIPCNIRQKGETLWQQSGEIEVLDFKDTVLTKNGFKTWKGVYTVTAWDTAQYQFPLIRFRLNGKELTGIVGPLTVNFEKKKVDDDIVEAEVPDVGVRGDFADDQLGRFFRLHAVAHRALAEGERLGQRAFPDEHELFVAAVLGQEQHGVLGLDLTPPLGDRNVERGHRLARAVRAGCHGEGQQDANQDAGFHRGSPPVGVVEARA